jgi:hypothetical protein
MSEKLAQTVAACLPYPPGLNDFRKNVEGAGMNLTHERQIL